LRPGGPLVGIDLDVVKTAKVEEDAIVDRAEPALMVAAAPHGDWQAFCLSDLDDLGDRVRVMRTNNEGRFEIEIRIPGPPGVIERRIDGSNDVALDPAGELVGNAARQGCFNH
jgi:hypothetical protein